MEKQSINVQDYIGLYGPKFGPKLYEEALGDAEFEQKLPQILQDLEPLIKGSAEGKRPFSLVAIMTPLRQAFTLTDRLWVGNEKFMDKVMERVNKTPGKDGLEISKKIIGNYRFFIMGWFVYNSESFNPFSELGDARMRVRLLKKFFFNSK